MKTKIKSLLFFGLVALTLVGCETYSDPKVEYTPIYPLSGEWRIRVTNLNTNALVTVGTTQMFTLGTYNTSDNATNQMWIRATSSIFTSTLFPTAVKTLKAKINCDVTGMSFSTTAITQNLNVTTNAVVDTVVITEGKVTKNSVSLPSGVTSDRISFKFAKSKIPGVTYFVEGYRRTLWNEDETVVTFK